MKDEARKERGELCGEVKSAENKEGMTFARDQVLEAD
jgi:hypothetical protein